MWDTLVFLEEDNQTHSHFTRCNMFIPSWYLKGSYTAAAMCERGVEIKNRRLVEEEACEVAAVDLQDYGRPLDSVS